MERGAHAGVGLLAGLESLWGTCTGAVNEVLWLVGMTHTEEVHGDCHLWEGPHTGAEECEDPPSKVAGAAETTVMK